MPTTKKVQSRSEYMLLNRALSRASDEEADFLIEYIRECADTNGVFEPSELALHLASEKYGLRLNVEDISEDLVQVIANLRAVEIRADWLFSFYASAARWMEKEKSITTDVAMDLLAMAINEVENKIDTARSVLANHPEALADDIHRAAASLAAHS